MSVPADEKPDVSWQRSAHRIGVPTLLVTVILCLLPNFILYLQYNAFPTWDVALAAWGMVATSFGAFYLVEPISYYPVLGLVGTYMSFLAGNVANMRLPCSAIAQEVLNVKPDTPEAEMARADFLPLSMMHALDIPLESASDRIPNKMLTV